jgi:acetolactate synthase-1/2/3 large subunit
MNLVELATASRYNLHVIDIIVDNQVLGMVRQWQTLYYGKRYSQTILTDKVDYCKVAEGMGCIAIRIQDPADVEPALQKALAADGPVVIDCCIAEDDKVFPMVSPGSDIAQAFDAEDLAKKQ